MNALLGKSNKGLGRQFKVESLSFLLFEEFKPKRRTIDRKLSGKDKRIEAFLNRVIWRFILKLITSPKTIIIDSAELKDQKAYLILCLRGIMTNPQNLSKERAFQ